MYVMDKEIERSRKKKFVLGRHVFSAFACVFWVRACMKYFVTRSSARQLPAGNDRNEYVQTICVYMMLRSWVRVGARAW